MSYSSVTYWRLVGVLLTTDERLLCDLMRQIRMILFEQKCNGVGARRRAAWRRAMGGSFQVRTSARCRRASGARTAMALARKGPSRSGFFGRKGSCIYGVQFGWLWILPPA